MPNEPRVLLKPSIPEASDNKGPWISPRFKANAWAGLPLDTDDSDAWAQAVEIVRDRIEGRFVRWIEFLGKRKFSGFAVIALDCLLIETLVGFMTGKPSQGNASVYKSFLTGELTGNTYLNFSSIEASHFCKNIRNGIIHDAETRHAWIIRPGDPDGQILIKDAKGNATLNRDAFHRALKDELKSWLARVNAGDPTLRKKMRDRMNQIIDTHFSL